VTAAIIDLERIAAAHWRGTEEEWLGQWLLRAAGGFTGRANSALPLGDPGLPLGEAVDYVTRWYTDRVLRPMIALPMPLGPNSIGPNSIGPNSINTASINTASIGPDSINTASINTASLHAHSEGSGSTDPAFLASELDAELVRRSWPDRGGPAFVMVTDIDADPQPGNTGPGNTGPFSTEPGSTGSGGAGPGSTGRPSLPAGLEFRADPVPDEAWLSTYHYRGGDSPPPVARSVLTSAAGQVFLSIRSGDDVAAIARLSLAEGWAGISAVEVARTSRRSGLGGALTREALAQAAARDVHRVFLQVEVGNHPAKALYERNGFRYSHRYHYRVAPASAT
jgi:N-acetylglutamate synthase